MTNVSSFPWQRILIWALVLGIPISLLADWGQWDQLPLNTVYRVLIVAAGGFAGWLLNVFAGNYVGMGTHVIESMGVFKFSNDVPKKIESGFVFMVAIVGAVLALFIVR
jgi:hypothetical protein